MQATGHITAAVETAVVGQSEKSEKPEKPKPETAFETILERLHQAAGNKKPGHMAMVLAEGDGRSTQTQSKQGFLLTASAVNNAEQLLDFKTGQTVGKSGKTRMEEGLMAAKKPNALSGALSDVKQSDKKVIKLDVGTQLEDNVKVLQSTGADSRVKTRKAENIKLSNGELAVKGQPGNRLKETGERSDQAEMASVLVGLRNLAKQPNDAVKLEKAKPASADSDIKLSTADNGKGGKISVVDMRLKAARQQGENVGKDSGGKASGDTFSGIADQAGRDLSQLPGVSRELVAHTSQPAAEAASQPASLADNLAARIRDSGAADIVKAAQIVLQDADTGIIRLQLEPASLGKVKIELKIADKKISGVIVVESDLAGKAFKDSLESLRDAFNASGLETAGLEVEVRNGNHEQSDKQAGAETAMPYYSKHLKDLDAAVPVAVTIPSRDGLVNVIV
jgi:flagellar hook-length control protein FliK